MLLLLVVGVAAAAVGSDCDGDLECLKRAYAVLQAEHEKATYKNQNLTLQSDKLASQVRGWPESSVRAPACLSAHGSTRPSTRRLSARPSVCMFVQVFDPLSNMLFQI